MGGTKRNARGEATRRALLQETTQLVRQFGYDATTISRITRATGKPASSIYWFFETKDELIAASLESTYHRQPEDIGSWSEFKPGRVKAQLQEILAEEFTVSATERPVRLGLMVALEGLSAGSAAQEPFKRRRHAVRQKMLAWWSAAATDAGFGDPPATATWMTGLTMAFLDGHYISDVESTGIDLTGRGVFVTDCLAGIFNTLRAGERDERTDPAWVTGYEDGTGEALPVPTTDAGPSPDLLAVTRQLLAERGYEGATMARICENSGMPRSSVYWRYPDKDRLVQAAVAGPFLALTELAKPQASPTHDRWRAQLAEAMITCVQSAASAPDTVRAGLLMKLQHRHPPSLASEDIRQGLARQEAGLRTWLEDAMSPATGEHADVGAWATTVLMEGLLLDIAFGHRYDLAVLRRAIESMVGAMGRQHSPADVPVGP